ncbi:hypothetical protein TNCV_880251 [Trichonephila clavipes]|nr:hypothetical protein TNCV_880251 [Trichonephila clavipes]
MPRLCWNVLLSACLMAHDFLSDFDWTGYRPTRERLVTDLVILNHGQVTRTTPVYPITPTGVRLSYRQILRASLLYTVKLTENKSHHQEKIPKGFSVSSLQTVRLQVFSWSPSYQHTANTDTMVEHAFIRKHNRSPLRPPMSPGFSLLASQMERTWSQWNTQE